MRFLVSFLFIFTAFSLTGCLGTETQSPTTISASLTSDRPSFDGLVTAETNGQGHVVLAWQSASDFGTSALAMTYDIYRSEVSLAHDFADPLATVTNGVLTYTDTGVSPGRTYYYVVRARNTLGKDDGNYIQKQVGVFTPIVFAGAQSGGPVSHDKVQLKFAPATGGSGVFTYKVFKNGDMSAPILTTGGVSPGPDGQVTVTVSGLTIATSYSFTVRANDGQSEDKNLNLVTVSTLAYQVPQFAGAASVVPKPGIPGQTSLTVHWQSASATGGASLDGYYVYYKPSGQPLNYAAPQIAVPPGDTQVDITGLTQGQSYDVVVRAVQNGLTEKNEIVKTATTSFPAPITFLGAQTAVPAAGADGFTKMNVFWAAAAGDFDHYQIFVSTQDLSLKAANDALWNTPTVTVFDTTATQKTISGLTASGHYYVVVRAANSVSNVRDSNQYAVQVTLTPPAPVFAGATRVSQPTGASGLNTLIVHWTNATGAVNVYNIYRKGPGGYDFMNPTGTVGHPTNSYADTGLTTGTESCYVVRAAYNAVSPALSEMNSVEVCGTPSLSAPSFAGLATCDVPDSGDKSTQLKLTWTPGTGVFDAYDIWQSSSPTVAFGSAPTLSFNSALESKVMVNLQPNTTYYFGMRARYTVSGQSDPNTVVRSCTTKPTIATFVQQPSGYVTSGGAFLNPTKVCLQDPSGSTVIVPATVTLSKIVGAGTLSGTLSKTASQGCATFSDLVYTGTDVISLHAAATNSIGTDTNAIQIITPSTPPPGACAVETADWKTGFGGCYNPATGVVIGTMRPVYYNLVVWEAAANLSDVRLHDWPNDVNANGRPDDYDPVSSFTNLASATGTCHGLNEGGYVDWKPATLTQALAIRNVPGFKSSLSFPINTTNAYFFTATQTVNGQTSMIDMNGGSVGSDYSTRLLFCVRQAETTYQAPSQPVLTTTVPAGIPGFTQIDLGWTGSSGSYSGYHLWWEKTSAGGVNFATPPKAQIKKGLTSYSITGLDPGVEYEIAIRAVWTNKETPLTDGNATRYRATTRAAKIVIARYNGYPLLNSSVPLLAKVVDPDTNLVINTTVALTATKTSGTAALMGTTVTNAVAGVAKFTGLSVDDYTGGKTLQLTVSAPGLTSDTTALVPIRPVAVGACKDFSETVYPAYNGCYFQSMNLVISARSPSTISYFYNVVWEAGPAPALVSARATDTQDSDGDGRPDDMDPENLGHKSPGTSGYCHSLTEGGWTDWKPLNKAQLPALVLLSPLNYIEMAGATTVWSNWSSVISGDQSFGQAMHLGNGNWSSVNNTYVLCGRAP